MTFYVLRNKVPVLATPEVWAQDAERRSRRFDADPWRVARTEIGDIRVSTVFLGLDHSFLGQGPPLLFETMIFGGDREGEMMRYSTWAEAELGHMEVVESLEKIGDPEPEAKPASDVR